MPEVNAEYLRGIAYGGGRYVTGGEYGGILVSGDGGYLVALL